ncbi:MAG: M1 family aminopeptidase, partial [Bacteroidota bacterium]
YCSQNFSPYQYKELRIVEFSQVGGASAHSYPNTIPTGEGAGFIANVDDSENGGVDHVFGTAVHEVAHQWWGGQVIPADSPGSKLVVESMAEYVNLKVKEHYRSKRELLKYMYYDNDRYLKGRSRKQHKENPLMYTRPSQNYIHYPKGGLALYVMSEYIGEDTLNAALSKYVKKVAFQEDNYTTSAELVAHIRAATPDSLQYLIEDWFETITFYDNELLDTKIQELDNGEYESTITFNISKYRSDGDGNIYYSTNQGDSLSYKNLHSLPLKDYIEIGVFDEDEEVLSTEKYQINKIHNQLIIKTQTKPFKVQIDPNYLLIDREREDDFWEG